MAKPRRTRRCLAPGARPWDRDSATAHEEAHADTSRRKVESAFPGWTIRARRQPAFPGSYPCRSWGYGKLFRVAPFARLAARVRFADCDLNAAAEPAYCADLVAWLGCASVVPSRTCPAWRLTASRCGARQHRVLSKSWRSLEERATGLTLISHARCRQTGPRNRGGVIACHEARSHGVRLCSRAVGRPDRCGRRHA